MDDYLWYLQSSLRKVEEKAFCWCFMLKSEDEVIMKEVWCDEEDHQETECPLHNDLPSKENSEMLENKLESRDIQPLPKCVHLRKSSTVGNEYGVWSDMEIPKGIRFGPYESIVINEDEADEGGYSWKTLEDKDIGCFVDVKNENESNWLRYVNFAPRQEQQNLIILQRNGQIYYETVRDMVPDTELLVWCRNECASLLGNERSDPGERCTDASKKKRFVQDTLNVHSQQHLHDQKKSSVCHATGHVKEHVQVFISCDGCEKRFLQNSQLEHRKHIHPTERIYACDMCEKTFTRKDVLKRHKNIHTGEKPYTCETCGKAFVQKNDLKQHKYTHTGQKPHICETCGKAFLQNSQLKRHEYTHADEKPYACETCGKAFVQKSHLKQHEYTHTGEKPYICETCGNAFVWKGHLEQHKYIHREEKPYICETCGKTFVWKGDLKQHKCTHTKEKPYICEACGKAFGWRNALERHKYTHTGEKRYACETCGKAFVQKSQLKRHNYTHTGEKPYACEMCEKAFVQKSHLKQHKYTHTGEKLYDCERWGKAFGQKST